LNGPSRPADGDSPANQDVSRTEVAGGVFQVRDVGGNVHISAPTVGHPPAPRGLRNPTFRAAMAFAVLVAIVIPGSFYVRDKIADDPVAPSAGPESSTPITEPVISVTTDTDPLRLGSKDLVEIYGRNQDWLVPHPKVVVGMPKDMGERQAESFYQFVRERGAVAVNRVFFNVTVQNLTGGAVYLRSIRVSGLRYGPALRGTRLWSGGGADPLTPKVILIDLDESAPKPMLFSAIEEQWLAPSERTRPDVSKAKNFGFTLPGSGTESFDIAAVGTRHRSCEFTLTIEAVVNGRSRQIRVDDKGKPFRVTGDGDTVMWQYYGVNDPERTWAGGPETGSENRWLRGGHEQLPETDP
jgi:hypothetical protein